MKDNQILSFLSGDATIKVSPENKIYVINEINNYIYHNNNETIKTFKDTDTEIIYVNNNLKVIYNNINYDKAAQDLINNTTKIKESKELNIIKEFITEESNWSQEVIKNFIKEIIPREDLIEYKEI